jgi:hypothetical protein
MRFSDGFLAFTKFFLTDIIPLQRIMGICGSCFTCLCFPQSVFRYFLLEKKDSSLKSLVAYL